MTISTKAKAAIVVSALIGYAAIRFFTRDYKNEISPADMYDINNDGTLDALVVVGENNSPLACWYDGNCISTNEQGKAYAALKHMKVFSNVSRIPNLNPAMPIRSYKLGEFDSKPGLDMKVTEMADDTLDTEEIVIGNID